ncbi:MULTISPECIES: serine/threonine-protein kinase [unclassified Coleofasciculus]|uniref:serine/threonine-protein kinase n=1 Tax=unclassified Coleofasciculus TaxID=2692782 RepID=UPI001D155390|nr:MULTISPECIES: serine/threonine-protein kinase [unclassified Coleofasciculus]
MVWVKGQQLHGRRYVIEREIGRGGFGITYLAKDRNGKPLVIKTLKDEVMTNPDFIEFRDKYQRDFEREATRLAVCRHPHIVQIENVFHEQSLPCIAMEYIQGEDLWRRVRNRHPLSEAEALGYIQQIGEALTLVHDKGLLHRDLKPQNIMVRSGVSEAVLIDFGIAREFLPNLTQTHSVHLTPGFAPLEQYDEQAHRGEYTDVYGLAATLYCLLTTKVPPPAFMRVVRDSLQPPQALNSKVSDRVNQGILTGMELQPENRPQSVSEWLQLLIPQNPAGDLSSECGIDYRRLRDLLSAGEWEKADQETTDKMLAVIGKKDWWTIEREDIDQFPCTDLRTIDRLWVKYSNGRFGFSVQKRIWQSVGGQPGVYDYGIYKKFGDTIGWYEEDVRRRDEDLEGRTGWRAYYELTFSLNAPQGHLPGSTYRETSESYEWIRLLRRDIPVCGNNLEEDYEIELARRSVNRGVRTYHLFSRVETCKM